MNRYFQKDIESSTEYVLPDYMGDVKKLLVTTASVVPSGRFVNGQEVEFSGIVTYDVYYADSEGNLTKASAVSDYDIILPINEENYNDATASLKVGNFAIRLTGPRKFIARATVTASIIVSENDTVTSGGDAFEEGRVPETASKSINVENVVFAHSAEREYAEEAAIIEGVSPDGLEILSTAGAVRIFDSRVAENGVLVSGEMIITAIIKTDAQPPFAIKKIIPFEETVELGGVLGNMQTTASGYLTSVTAGACESGENTSVTVNAILELECSAAQNREMTVLTDAYIKNRDTMCEYEDYSYSELVAASCCVENVNADVLREGNGYENVREVLFSSCELKALNKKLTKNGIEVSGESIVSGVACELNVDNSISYIPVKFSSPFAFIVNCGCQMPEGAKLECQVLPVCSDISIDSEKLYSKNTLAVSYRISLDKTLKRLKTCNLCGDTEYVSKLSTVTVYYPSEDDTLFDVARRFHTTGLKIAADNSLTESVLLSIDTPSSLVGVKKIIIR